MNRRSITRWLTLGLAVTAVAATAAVLPAFGSQDVVRLHFAPDGSSVAFTYNNTTQALIPTTRCEISSDSAAGPLMTLTSNRKLGINSNGIGVKTGGSQGTPCGRVDTTENITLSIPASGVLVGRTMNKMALDLELKGNAWVEVTLSRAGSEVGPVFGLQTGSSIQAGLTPLPGPPYMATSTSSQPVAACASPSDSGPDSGANDNCLWTIEPGLEFDKATFTVRVGEFSLEGSGDFGGNSDYDSRFYLSNRAPVAGDDAYATDEDTPLTVAAPGVLANDSDADGDDLTAAIATNLPLGDGSVSLASDGSFTYTPSPDFNGSTSFTYRAWDGTSYSLPATVTITVRPVNDPPAFTGGGISTDEDTPGTGVVAGDIDSTEFTVNCGPDVTDNGGGEITYQPPSNENGEVTLSCTASDGEFSVEGSVTVTIDAVNDAPVATNDPADTDAGLAVTIDVLDNDTDVDSLSLTVSVVTGPTNGAALVNTDGTVTYTPDLDFVGTDSFSYEVSDGFLAATATVKVTVYDTICTNDPVPFESELGTVYGTITKLTGTGPAACKRFTLIATDPTESSPPSLLFQPASGPEVTYRAYLTLGQESAANPLMGQLEYDPEFDGTFKFVPWCESATFSEGDVVNATMPSGDSWCIASETTVASDSGMTTTTWQVYGLDDPKFQ